MVMSYAALNTDFNTDFLILFSLYKKRPWAPMELSLCRYRPPGRVDAQVGVELLDSETFIAIQSLCRHGNPRRISTDFCMLLHFFVVVNKALLASIFV
jgi:hypothetical protein